MARTKSGTGRGGTRSGGATTRARRPRPAASRRAVRRRTTTTTNGRGVVYYLDALWMGLAHGVGWVVRAVGRKAATARGLEPEHRRDGVGLLMIGMAIVLAVAVWFDRAGHVGAGIAQA